MGARSAAFRGDVGALDDTPYAAFGRLATSRRRLPGGVVDVAFDGAAGPDIQAWIDGALRAVAAYYERVPHRARRAHRARRPVRPRRHERPTPWATAAPRCSSPWASARRRRAGRDWTLVHELVHVSFPDVSTPWVEEGLATYLEPVIRVRSGLCDADEVWRSLVEGLPQGQPEAGDGGLDVTDTWGRRYWGGAIFWFVADLEIRKRTGNARSLDDALRAVNRARRQRLRALGARPRARRRPTGAPASRCSSRCAGGSGSAPVRVDLDALWKRLGVAQVEGKMVYDDAAPLAGVRRAINGEGRAGERGSALRAPIRRGVRPCVGQSAGRSGARVGRCLGADDRTRRCRGGSGRRRRGRRRGGGRRRGCGCRGGGGRRRGRRGRRGRRCRLRRRAGAEEVAQGALLEDPRAQEGAAHEGGRDQAEGDEGRHPAPRWRAGRRLRHGDAQPAVAARRRRRCAHTGWAGGLGVSPIVTG